MNAACLMGKAGLRKADSTSCRSGLTSLPFLWSSWRRKDTCFTYSHSHWYTTAKPKSYIDEFCLDNSQFKSHLSDATLFKIFKYSPVVHRAKFFNTLARHLPLEKRQRCVTCQWRTDNMARAQWMLHCFISQSHMFSCCSKVCLSMSNMYLSEGYAKLGWPIFFPGNASLHHNTKFMGNSDPNNIAVFKERIHNVNRWLSVVFEIHLCIMITKKIWIHTFYWDFTVLYLISLYIVVLQKEMWRMDREKQIC